MMEVLLQLIGVVYILSIYTLLMFDCADPNPEPLIVTVEPICAGWGVTLVITGGKIVIGTGLLLDAA